MFRRCKRRFLDLPLAQKFVGIFVVLTLLSGALMIGALMIHGIQPGPQIMVEQRDMVWAVIVSMWIGNLMLLVINLPLIGMWVSLLKVPYRLLFPAILLFCCVGAYGASNSVADVWLMLGCAVVGYFFIKVKVETAPLLLGLVLGPQIEENLRRALLISDGDFSVFVTRPISAFLLGTVVVILVVLLSPAVLKKRQEIVESD